MTGLFDKLNLRHFERRLVVVVGIILFVVAQVWFVWPHFGDYGKLRARQRAAEKTLQEFRAELAQKDKFAAEVKRLEDEGGLAVPAEDQATDLLRAVDAQARQSQVSVQSSARPLTITNQFFLERSQQITTVSTEDGLINFLFNLGAGNSLIRVRDLSLRPDQARMRLNANIQLVASYQKNPRRAPATGGAAANATPVAARVPAAPPAPSPSTPRQP